MNLNSTSTAELEAKAKELGIVLDENESRADLIAKVKVALTEQERDGAIQAAVALVIDAEVHESFHEDGYPKLESVAEVMGGEAAGLTEDQVRAAADAVWEKKEDGQTGAEGGGGSDGAGGGVTHEGDQGDKEDAEPSAPSQAPRDEVIKATAAIIKAKEPLERGVPALWALRDAVKGPVKKAEAAAAYEEVTGKPWPWPPTRQQLNREEAAGNLLYPRGLYHKEKKAITVESEAKEAAAREDGYVRSGEMKPEDWVKAWARETGASEEAQEEALKSVKNDRQRNRT